MHPSYHRSTGYYNYGPPVQPPPPPPSGYLNPYMSRSLPAIATATHYSDFGYAAPGVSAAPAYGYPIYATQAAAAYLPLNYYNTASRGRYYQDPHAGSGTYRSRSLQPYYQSSVPRISNYYSSAQPYYANYAANAYPYDPYYAATASHPYTAAAYPRSSHYYYPSSQYDPHYYTRGGGGYYRNPPGYYDQQYYGGGGNNNRMVDSAYRTSGYSTLPTRSSAAHSYAGDGGGYYDFVPPTRSYGQQDPYTTGGGYCYYGTGTGGGGGRTGVGYDNRSYSYSDVYGSGRSRWPTAAASGYGGGATYRGYYPSSAYQYGNQYY